MGWEYEIIGSKMNLHIYPVHTPDKYDIIFLFKHTTIFKRTPTVTPQVAPRWKSSAVGS